MRSHNSGIITLVTYPYPSAACVEGLSDPALASCNRDGSRDYIDQQDYTCNTGYFVSGPPVYCTRMVNAVPWISQPQRNTR
jgi:hypothetical protein